VSAFHAIDVLAVDMIHGAWELLAVSAEPAICVPERVCVLDPRLTTLGWPLLADTVKAALARPDLLTLLIPAALPPPVTGRGHDPVLSFIGPELLLRGVNESPERLCFTALGPLLSGSPPTGIGVVARECPAPDAGLPEWDPSAPAAIHASVVMAHRGSSDHLRAALAGLAGVQPGPAVVRVGLDGDLPADLQELSAAFPDVEFYADLTAGRVGPYAIRQAVVEACPEPFVVFHDSDDVSTADRFHWLLARLAQTDSGLVGSYELRYDTEDREVRASRFPLDVTAALKVEPRHPLLHPTSAISRERFQRAGGFATDCIFGNDTQFLLRAFFHMPVINIPRFLYIRREHPDSLTCHPETGMDNPVRAARNQQWRNDFLAVLGGSMPLSDSSLLPTPGPNWRPLRVSQREVPR
jgi:hypothetical protein